MMSIEKMETDELLEIMETIYNEIVRRRMENLDEIKEMIEVYKHEWKLWINRNL